MATRCKKQADDLLKILRDLADKEPKKFWKTMLQALRTVLKDKEIHASEVRLDQFRSQLMLRLVRSLSTNTSEINQSIQQLTLVHAQIGVNSENHLSDLKDDLLRTMKKVEGSQESLEQLGTQIKSFLAEGGKLARQQAVLTSLAFTTMTIRRPRIVEARTKTFEWMLAESSDGTLAPTKFPHWLRHSSGIYWIAGKAGSGKSTLMKYLVKHDEVNNHLLTWANPLKLVTSSYFFWGAGNELQKSQSGLLRSLLYDIIRQCPNLIPDVLGKITSDTSNPGPEDVHWSLPYLMDVLEWLPQQQPFPARFCFFH
ncbi:hypothetical protein EG329_000016 [Mollisiaceae sp. DMI_Dod_QoI]|nr:hypothetical protein EG329_000016 [Helotiales sp. DMI_Dod_QoI]